MTTSETSEPGGDGFSAARVARRVDYTRLIDEALDYIEQHLDENLSLEQIAARVYVSPFHFHRVFTAAMGVPLMRFVREQRIARAAIALRSTGRTVQEIALDAGFESPSAFIRAFQDVLGLSPGRYRRLYGVEPKESQASHPLVARKDGPVSRIVMKPAMDLVGVPLDNLDVGQDNSPAIVRLWQAFYEDVIGTDTDYPPYGVFIPGPGSTFSYLAAVDRRRLDRVPPECRPMHLDAHEYAVFPHDEGRGSTQDAFRDI